MNSVNPEAADIFTVERLASMIDHAVLNPELTDSEIESELEVAAELGVFAVFVPTAATRRAVEFLAGTGVVVGAPIGFPHGSSSSASKLAEVDQAILDGAAEIDVVQQIGWIRSGRFSEAQDEIARVVERARGRVVKVILETAYLNDEQVALSSKLASEVGATFVKTSTGFASSGATAHNLRIMRNSVGRRTEIKASSGVRTLETALELLQLGVTRFGMSATRKVLRELGERNSCASSAITLTSLDISPEAKNFHRIPS